MQEKYITINELKTRYFDEGEGDVILILHGWGSSINSWEEVMKELTWLNFRVIALDLPGFGKSDEPKEAWNLKNYSEFINAFVKKFDLQSFTLLGHSFGGRIAIDYSTKFPHDLYALVLIAAAGVIRYKKLKIVLFSIFTKLGNLIFSLPGLKLFKSIASDIWYKISGEHDYEKASNVMQKTMKQVLRENIRQYLPNIKQHTLILWGEKDAATPISNAYILHNEIPLTRLKIFEQMPHALNLKIPKEVANEIFKFLKEG